ncbi:MAG: M48 family metallopeptidase [Sodaliphilus pleomorphus]|uniref:M48 family metallopeptidase n=1 Tax=Sodaliphilus pleomorphus TaxID=2606626 RepID=UPI0024093036|nr:M48 family metallopeptidase [Sodaliphilus pleomorphus]MDD6475784.1 M48 family metallopeptidase [Sodaliphilus pleomorphus]
MNAILVIIIAFVLLEFVLSSVLSYLNGRWMTHPIPQLLQGLYDEQQYAKQQHYMRANRRVSSLKRGVEVVVTLVLLAAGVYGRYDNWCKSCFDTGIVELLVFFFGCQLFIEILSIPFSYYSTFNVEQRYGFNKTTAATFWLDCVKEFLVEYVMTAIVMCGIFLLFQWLGSSFWIWATCFLTAIIVIVNLFYSSVIVPLFNKQTPLEAGILRQAIEQAAARMQFKIKNIYVINGSKRSTKANAYFTGFGPKKRIVLYDTLIEQLSTDEIVAVLAHEIGHYKHHDTLIGMVRAIAMVAAYLWVFSLVVSSPELPAALGGTAPSFALSILAFSMLLTPIEIALNPVANILSRRAEYKADAFAARHGLGAALVSGLKKLSVNTMSNLTPHPLVVWFNYSHPTLYQRILAINKIQK